MIKAVTGALALAGTVIAAPLSAQLLSNPDSAFKDNTSRKAWHATVERTESGWLIGNPDAETRLILL